MKNSYKAALLAVLGLTVVSAAQAANNDLILGFNDLAGSSSAQNDLTINLASYSDFTTTASLTFTGSTLDNGNFASDFSSAFGSDPTISDVAAGVVGANLGTSSRTLFATGAATPTGTINYTSYRSTLNEIQAISIGSQGSSAGLSAQNGWSYFVAPSPTLAQTSGQSETTVAQYLSQNPEQNLSSSGIITETLYQSTEASLGATGGAFSEIGTITIDVPTDTVTFNGIDSAPVPEPTTYGLLAGAGLLLVGVRRQFVKKNA